MLRGGSGNPSAAAAGGGGGGNAGRPANAAGALALVSKGVAGTAAIAVAGGGFAALGIVRLTAAWRDRRPSRWARVGVAGQGVLYLALTAVPVSFLRGKSATG